MFEVKGEGPEIVENPEVLGPVALLVRRDPYVDDASLLSPILGRPHKRKKHAVEKPCKLAATPLQ